MSALPQCDAFGYIYDQAGDPAPDVLVTLKKVIDASGNSILLSPLTTLTDPAGSFHFTLPEDAAATISARASGLWNCPDGRVFKVPPGPSGELIATFLLPGSSSVVPPLIYVSDTLSLPRSSASADGYLAAADYVRFDAATDITGGVSSFASRTGDILPLVADYQAFYLRLTGGALTGSLTLAADPTMPMQAATMQYVLNQLAAATAGVSSFNLRTGVVTPLIGDYASFYAPVTHAHTRSQITDLGVFSTSQPGLVPQPTSGDAARVLSGAGTWIDAATSSAPALPATYYVTDFKASGSAAKFTGTVSAGTTALTTTAASDFVIGQGIYIAGAGTSGAALVTKVDAISGTSITLHDAAATTVTAVANNVQHDDTVAIQAAIDACYAGGGGTISFAPGHYRINKGLTDINSILKFPFVDSTTRQVAIALVSQVPNPYIAFLGPVTTTANGKCVIIQTDLIGANTNSSMIAGATFNDSGATPLFTLVNNYTLFIDGIIFRTYGNPQISAIDLGMFSGPISIKNCFVDCGLEYYNTTVEPTHDTFGLRFPRDTAAVSAVSENNQVVNYGVGLIASEVLTSVYTTALRCKVGLRLTPGHHLNSGRFLLWQCPTQIEFAARTSGQPLSPVDFVIDFEIAQPATGWYSPIAGRDIYDPSNYAVGKIEYLREEAFAGGLTGVSVSGCANLSLVNLGLPRKTIIDGNVSLQDLSVYGTLLLTDTSGVLQPVTAGANASATDTGYRELEIPNGAVVSGLLANIVSYWKMEESTGTRFDSVTTTANDLASGNGSAISFVGQIGNCAYANADYLYKANNATLHFLGSMSVAGWIRISSLAGSSGTHTLLSKYYVPGSQDWAVVYSNSAGKWQFIVSADGTTLVKAEIATTPAINTWYFVAAVFNSATGQISISVNDGTPATTAFAGPIFYDTTSSLASLLLSSNFGDCAVDEIGLWSKALNSTEITALYNGGSGLQYPF